MADSRCGNYTTCCRLCLADSAEFLRPVFGENSHDRGLQLKISASLGVEIQSSDKLTTMVCLQCIEKITSWQSFKHKCSENQSKLEHWLIMNSSIDSSDGNIQIKEEPIDSDLHDVTVNGEPIVKNEPIEEEYSELPPPLTPQDGDDVDVEVVSPGATSQTVNDDAPNPRKCSVCSKLLSSASNRKKHERLIHGKTVGSTPLSGSVSQDEEKSQSSIDSQNQSDFANINEQTADEKKILFAAGLKLLQRNSTPSISQESLSRIENSYVEKCKAMVTMHKTLRCACHNQNHPNLKGLLSHLRAMRIWFPVFTCYHCMITFTDRSSSTRHYVKCQKSDLETLVRLSNLRKRSEVKTRLYQNFKCTECRFMYSFHEDYVTHVNEEHCGNVILPYRCSCGRLLTTIDGYRDHVYVNCLVEFYCDICFVTVKSLEEFRKHAAEVHDLSEGFILLQEDKSEKKSPMPLRAGVKQGIKREHADESNIISGKRRSHKAPILESEDSSDDKVINPATMQKLPGTTCPMCNKEYSSNNNMWRHYKSHFQEEKKEDVIDDSYYCCPDCGGMFNTIEWEKHKTMHKKRTCNECGKVFQFQSELEQHRSVHLNLKLYRDSKTKSYKSTMASPNNESNNIVLMCEICDRMFTSKEALRDHKVTHETMPVLESVETMDEKDKKKKYSCDICNKHYSGYGGLWDHNRKKHPDMKSLTNGNFPRKCEYCEKVFVTAGSYNMHRQMHERNLQLQQKNQQAPPVLQNQMNTEEEPNEDDSESYHTCKRCFKVFANRSNLKNHMKSHGSPTTKKNNKKVWCNVCHCAFESSAVLDKHKKEEHGSIEMPDLKDEQIDLKVPFVFTCDICVQTFTTKQGLKRHKERHAKEQKPVVKNKQTVYCKYCKISFSSAADLSRHMNEEHMEDTKPPSKKEKQKIYPCPLCGKTYTTASALCAHQGWHKRPGKESQIPKVEVKKEPKETSQFQCNKCNAVLPNDTALQIHILEKHRNVNATVLPARCTMCNLDFNSQDEYEQHKKFHAMVEKAPKNRTYGCTQCPAGFNKAEYLKTHIRQFHKEAQQHQCHYCERVFEKANSLSIHLKVHEKQRLISGTVKPANSKPMIAAKPISALKSSPTVATPRPLFSCSICNKGFAVPKDLRLHTIQAHPF